MKTKRRRYIKKILKPTFSVGTGLFLLLQVLAGALMPVSLDFWRPGLQN